MEKLLAKLKNKDLSFQIWIIVAVILSIFFILQSITVPFVIRGVIKSEKKQRILENQDYLISEFEYPYTENTMPDLEFDELEFDKKDQIPVKFSRVIRHFHINQERLTESNIDWFNQIKEDLESKTGKAEVYIYELDQNREFYYSIRKISDGKENSYLISYIKTHYRDLIVWNILKRLFISFGIILIISAIISYFITRYLAKPLKKLQKDVKRVARREWEKPLNINRDDEIGEFAKTIDWMREQLLERDKSQQEFLQQISHEIKTPIMVLRGYIQSLQDGIYPKGDLEGTLTAMETESYKMEKRVGSLINITKMDYLSHQNLELEELSPAEVVSNKMEELNWRPKSINWSLNSSKFTITADKDKLVTVIENIVDNQFKYASSLIKVEIEKASENGKDFAEIKFWNDGPEISAKNLEKIFMKFKKGEDGDYGLGLSIARVLLELHGGSIKAVNENNGAAFYIRIPIKADPIQTKKEKNN
jgi:two-component system sensor histidine kinase CssS